MAESVFKKKERIRPPRVHIQYEVELNGAMVQKELPFVMGVVADLSGEPAEPLGRLKDRQFVNIDRDNFDGVLSSMQPRLVLRVDSKLPGADKELSVELKFDKLEDFDPENVARQVAPLAALLKTRTELKDLIGRTEGNDRLEEQLEAMLSNAELSQKVKSAVAAREAGRSDDGGKPGEGA
jgi:type VI secretion system protein ImpB